jgi:hypothetical protein
MERLNILKCGAFFSDKHCIAGTKQPTSDIQRTSSFGTLAADATIKDGGIFNKIFDS